MQHPISISFQYKVNYSSEEKAAGCAIVLSEMRMVRRLSLHWACYHRWMFNFGRPKTVGDWVVHVAGALVAIFLVWWMLRMYVL